MKNIRFFIFLSVLVNSLMISGLAMVQSFSPAPYTDHVVPPSVTVRSDYTIEFVKPPFKDVPFVDDSTTQWCKQNLTQKKKLHLIGWICWAVLISQNTRQHIQRISWAIVDLLPLLYYAPTEQGEDVEDYNLKFSNVLRIIVLRALILLRQAKDQSLCSGVGLMESDLVSIDQILHSRVLLNVFLRHFMLQPEYMRINGFDGAILKQREWITKTILDGIPNYRAVEVFQFALHYNFEDKIQSMLRDVIPTLAPVQVALILEHAVMQRRTDIVAHLLTRVHKPNFDVINVDLHPNGALGDAYHYSPLHTAVQYSSPEIIQLFFKPQVNSAVNRDFVDSKCSYTLMYAADSRSEYGDEKIQEKQAVFRFLTSQGFSVPSSSRAGGSSKGSSISAEGDKNWGILAIPAVALTLAAAGGIGYLMTKKPKKEQSKKAETKDPSQEDSK